GPGFPVPAASAAESDPRQSSGQPSLLITRAPRDTNATVGPRPHAMDGGHFPRVATGFTANWTESEGSGCSVGAAVAARGPRRGSAGRHALADELGRGFGGNRMREEEPLRVRAPHFHQQRVLLAGLHALGHDVEAEVAA